jgi:DNA repair exonuclease SbcCD ATPase subunit
MQDQQVRALAEQASQLESDAVNSAAQLERVRTELGEVEERLTQEADPTARRGLADQRTQLREALERENTQEHEVHRRAAEVNQTLAAEKGRLEELNQALEALENTLESPGRETAAPEEGARRR